MPSATVPMCTFASSPSSRSATSRGSPVRNTSSGILRLVAKRAARQRGAAAAPRHLELELAGGGRQHDEPALGAADVDGRIQDQRQHVVEHAPGPEGAQPFEEGGNLAQVADGGRRGGPVGDGLRFGDEKDHLGAAAASETDAVAVHERALGDLLAVDVGAVPRAAVPDHESAVRVDDFGVVARHLAPGQAQIVGFAAADLERRLGDRDDAAAQGVGDFQAGLGHSTSVPQRRRVRRVIRRTAPRPASTAAAVVIAPG